MRYVFTVPGAEHRVMHISKHDRLGNDLMEPLCDTLTQRPFNRTINAPWGLGRPVCKKCRRMLRDAA